LPGTLFCGVTAAARQSHGTRDKGEDRLADDRLPTDLWVMAQVRRCNAEAVPAVVVRRGEAKGGTLLLKLNQLEDGCRVLTQARDLDGRLAWLAAFKGELVPGGRSRRLHRPRGRARSRPLGGRNRAPRRLAPLRRQGAL